MGQLIRENLPLSQFSTMRVGGKAKYVIIPDDVDGLKEAIRKARFSQEAFFVAGNCSNVIFPDEGFDGAVIITSGVKGVCVDGARIAVNCGETLNALARAAMENSITGFEFCHGIPGTVGGGIYMNAGAYGGEISGVMTRCLVLDEYLDEKDLSCEEAEFGYRESAIANKGYFLLSAEFAGTPGDRSEISAKMDDLMSRRKASQPLEYPSCGSAFKRPVGHYAGALIEQCGLKGASVGGAEVSKKHAGFIINKGGATASDVIALIDLVRRTVFESTGVTLEPEIKIVGAG